MGIILDLLFPKKCAGCKTQGRYFCQDCIYKILQKELICPECERPSVGGQTHSKCKKIYGLDGLWSLGAYQGTLKSAITSLKYKPLPDLANILTQIVIDYWGRHGAFFLEKLTEKWLVTSVPLFWYRKNKRGFNQSQLLAQNIANHLGLRYIELLKRVKNTESQVKLRGEDRRYNIQNAFAISSNYTLHPNHYTLIVDDVWTTGSTLKECAFVLKKAGAKKVWAVTLAR